MAVDCQDVSSSALRENTSGIYHQRTVPERVKMESLMLSGVPLKTDATGQSKQSVLIRLILLCLSVYVVALLCELINL